MRHFTCPPKGAFSYDLHVLRMPPALILSQDQTLQLNLEFSHTRAHYLVFKEQIHLYNIIGNFLPLSRGLFLFRALAPRSGTNIFNRSPLHCQVPEEKFFFARGAWPFNEFS